ncbi:MAG: DUF1311 domain-containing protein [Xanthobacteraceae bacterium]|nr:DUF1311 domain-containing protein [Xanthobacteraceae bacterium]
MTRRAAMVSLATLGAVILGAWLPGVPASAAEAPVAACLHAAGDKPAAQERCIGKVSGACIGPDEGARSDGDVIGCLDGEQAQWDKLLNASYQALLKGLEPEQQAKLREMQRSWIDARKKSCEFFYDFFQGTMANPMIAYCMNQETARRAIFLGAFAGDMADWKK